MFLSDAEAKIRLFLMFKEGGSVWGGPESSESFFYQELGEGRTKANAIIS